MIQHAPTQAARLHLKSLLFGLHCYAHGNNVGKIVKALERNPERFDYLAAYATAARHSGSRAVSDSRRRGRFQPPWPPSPPDHQRRELDRRKTGTPSIAWFQPAFQIQATDAPCIDRYRSTFGMSLGYPNLKRGKRHIPAGRGEVDHARCVVKAAYVRLYPAVGVVVRGVEQLPLAARKAIARRRWLECPNRKGRAVIPNATQPRRDCSGNRNSVALVDRVVSAFVRDHSVTVCKAIWRCRWGRTKLWRTRRNTACVGKASAQRPIYVHRPILNERPCRTTACWRAPTSKRREIAR